MDAAEDKFPFLRDGIAQIAFVVKNLEETVRRYWEIFGIGPWHFYTYGKPLVRKMSYQGKTSEYSMRIALSYIGKLRIELIQPLNGDSIYKDFIREHGYGLHHVGLLVDDMEKAVDEADKSGYSVVMDGSGFGLHGDGHYAYLDTEDDIAICLELIERPSGRHPPEYIYPPPEE